MTSQQAGFGGGWLRGFTPIVALLGVSLLAITDANAAAVGTTAGSFSVTPSGAASYSIPISVAPGSGGMTPKLSLNYSSSGGNGPLGLGWSIGGLSAVSRCPATLAQDNFVDGVDFDDNDRLCLDGQRLVAVSGAYGSAGTEYRTEIDTFTKVVAGGAINTAGAHYEARTVAGLIYEYGRNSSRFAAPGPGATLRSQSLAWPVNRISDTVGNYMDFFYSQNTDSKEQLLTHIQYTGNDGAGVTPYASVQFEYEQRPDVSNGAVYGGWIRSEKRLKAVRSYVDGALVREYRLTYQVTGASPRSQLKSVEECTPSECLNPTQFEWSGTTTGFNAPRHTGVSSVGNNRVRDMAADFDGDGITDLMIWHFPSENARFNFHKGTRSGNFEGARATTVPAYANRYINNYEVADFSGDGVLDILTWHEPHQNNQFNLHINNGDATFKPARATTIDTYENPSLRNIVTDFNGDGRADMLTWHAPFGNNRYNIYFSNGDGTFTTPQPTVIAGYDNPLINNYEVGDFTGDGLPDVLMWHVPFNNNRFNLYRNNGNGFDPAIATTIQTYDNPKIRNIATDVNGDGLMDLLVWHAPRNNNQYNVYYATGSTTAPFELGAITHVNGYDQLKANNALTADVTGDGLPEMLVYNTPIANGKYNLYRNNGLEFDSVELTTIDTWENIDIPNRTGDFNGDGVVDLLVWHVPFSDHYGLILSGWSPPPQVTRITSGLGAVVELTYKPMTDTSVYTPGPLQSYPLQRVQGAMRVVSNVKSSDGLGGLRSVDYQYEDMRADARGRGNLGFRRMVLIDRVTNLTTSTTYRQDWPYVGSVSRETVKNDLSQTLTDVESFFAKKELGSGTARRQFVYASRTVERTHSLTPGNTVNKSTESLFTYGEPLSAFYGGLTSSTVHVRPGHESSGLAPFTTQTSNEYHPVSSSTWRLRRLSRSVVQRTNPSGYSAYRESAFQYDPYSGLLTMESLEPSRGALALHTQYEHDACGNTIWTRVGVQDPNGGGSRDTQTQYDTKCRFPVSVTNALGHKSIATFDSATGKQLTSKDPNGLTTTRQYDSFGRVTGETRPDGTTSTVSRSWCGACPPANSKFRVITSGSDGSRSLAYHDILERPLGAEARSFDGSYIWALNEYDVRGRTSRKSAPHFVGGDPFWTEFTYDDFDRVVRETAPANQNSPGGRITQFEYDGLTIKQTDARGKVRYTHQDAIGNTERVVDPYGGETRYTYDAFANLVSVIDANGNVSNLVYDERGRKVSSNDPDMGTWTYGYDKFSDLAWQRDAKGVRIDFTYDKLGRKLTRTEPEVAQGLSRWTWDTLRKGSLTSVTGINGYTETYGYDSLSRMSSLALRPVGGSTYSFGYTYDTQSRPSQITYPTGLKVRYSYNGRGFLTGISNVTTGTQYLAIQAMDQWGKSTLFDYGNGVSTVRALDAARGFPTAILASKSGTNLQSMNYDWDVLGNLASRTDQLQSGLQETFDYDDLNRLTRARRIGGGMSTITTTLVSYDAIGNITSKNAVGNYTYGARPHAVTSITGTRPGSFTYDANGNQLTGWDRTMTWNVRDLPSRMVKGSNQIDYLYGPDGQKTRQTTYLNGAGGPYSQTVTYAGSLFEVHQVPTGTLNKHYIQAMGETIAIVNTGAQSDTRYLHRDHLDSVELVTSETGAELQRSSYDAFGKRRFTSWNNNNTDTLLASQYSTDYGFTGHEQLDGVGLIHMGGRVYDPVLGRFTSADPFVQFPESTQGLNRYAYVNNNPLSFTDPSGFFSLKQELGNFEQEFRQEIRREGSYLGPTIAGVVTAVVSWYCAYTCSGATYAGAIAIVGGTNAGVAKAQGASTSEALKAGGISAATFAASQYIGGSASLTDTGKVVAHGAVGALSTYARGGNLGRYFGSFAVSALGGAATGKLPVELQGVAELIIAGTASAIGGGKFANGAGSVAFQFALDSSKRLSDFRVRATSSIDPDTGAHEYVIRGEICSQTSAGCNDQLADAVYGHVNANDIPFTTDDLRAGRHDLFFGTDPIIHSQNASTRVSLNVTLDGHRFHPGNVVHRVHFENGRLYYDVIGTGTGGSAWLNNRAGIFLFKPGVDNVVNTFGR